MTIKMIERLEQVRKHSTDYNYLLNIKILPNLPQTLPRKKLHQWLESQTVMTEKIKESNWMLTNNTVWLK